MKKMKFSLVAVAALLSTNFIHAQTADDVIAKHIEAMGGKDKIAAITSMQTEMTSEVMGNSSDAKITQLNGKGYKMETSFNGQDIVSVITDKGGWGINPMTGNTDAQEMPDEQYNMSKDQINIGSPFLTYPANGYKAELDGTEKVGSVDALKLKMTSPAGLVITDDVDPVTYYILKSVISKDGSETSLAFSDYKKTDFGYVMPYTVATTLPQGLTINSTITKVSFNEPVDQKIFDMPK